MRTAVTVLISIIVLFITSAAVAQDAAKLKPITTPKQLMELIVIPASDVLFNVVAEPPKNDEEWTKVRNNLLILAESGNLLMIGAPARDKAAWIKYSVAMQETSIAALKAAGAKDADAVIEAGDRVLATCSGCHDIFLNRTTGGLNQ